MKTLQEKIKEITERNKVRKETKNHYGKPKKKWITEELVRKIRRRDRLINRRNKEKEESKRKGMNRKISRDNKIIKEEIEKLKDTYYKQELERNKKDKKQHWKILNEIMKGPSQGKDRKILLEYEGTTFTEEKECAQIINNFFLSMLRKGIILILKMLQKSWKEMKKLYY